MINFELEECKKTLEYSKYLFGVDIKVNDNSLVIEARDWDAFSEIYINSLHLQDLVRSTSRLSKIKKLMDEGTVFTFSKEEHLKVIPELKENNNDNAIIMAAMKKGLKYIYNRIMLDLCEANNLYLEEFKTQYEIR